VARRAANDDQLRQRREIGQRIRDWRLKRALSQVAVARVAGVTQASLSNYETGKRDLPLSTFFGILAALDIGVSELLDTPEIVVVRDSRLGRAVEHLRANPELAERLTPSDAPASDA
jgi:transcriptional regulator with XRE-family HTH domain